jgi:DNA-binding SARP family transcriptional activator
MRAAKPIAALVYVGTSPTREVGRDRLAQLLWPGTELADARHSLRQSIYRLRQRAGRDLFLGDGDGRVALAPGVHIDCLELEGYLAAGDLEPAFNLLDGEFLEGVSADGAVELENWIESQRSRYRATWQRVGQQLVDRALEETDLTRALELAEQLAVAFPLEDEPTVQLMRVLAAQGRHAAAVSR